MARGPSLLSSTTPTAIAPAAVLIGHIQLRDLIICPRERGVVNYVHKQSIIEHNLNAPDSSPFHLVDLNFQPNTVASLPISGTDDILIAAGGQDAEVHLSYCSPRQRRGVVWQTECQLTGSINNSVLLTSMSLTRSNESSAEPRIGISNNDSTVKFYNIPIRGASKRNLEEVGCLRLDIPVNYSSISPDGRTLLSVGDSAKVFLHQMTGGARITFSPMATLKLPSPTTSSSTYIPSSLMASFSTAFSADGSKFAVASQEGLLAVWDVRSSRPLKIFETDKSRQPRSSGIGGIGGWASDEIYDWSGSSFRAPGWSVRNVKFGGSGDKEIMTFTEHTSLLHVVDARTFETEQMVQVPTLRSKASSSNNPPSSTPVPQRPSSPRPRHHHHHHHHHHDHDYQHRPGDLDSRTAPSRTWYNTSSTPPSPPTHTASIPTSLRFPRHQSTSRIVQALGDTFRISSPYSPPSSISDSTWRALRMSDPARSTAAAGEEYLNSEEDILVIPHLGDSAIESDVQALLGSHGIRSARPQDRDQDHHRRSPSYTSMRPDGRGVGHEREDTNTGSVHADYEYTPGRRSERRNGGYSGGDSEENEIMILLEGSDNRDGDHDYDMESECSSRVPSRSPSPSPSSHRVSTREVSPLSRGGGRYAGQGQSQNERSTNRDRSEEEDVAVVCVDDLDIAGTCFDPTGRFVYVATTEGVVEWGVRGSEKRWWGGCEWK